MNHRNWHWNQQVSLKTTSTCIAPKPQVYSDLPTQVSADLRSDGTNVEARGNDIHMGESSSGLRPESGDSNDASTQSGHLQEESVNTNASPLLPSMPENVTNSGKSQTACTCTVPKPR